MRSPFRFAACAVATLCILSVPSVALAAVGVGTDTGVIHLKEDVKAGGEYRLPGFQIGNTGTVKMGYVLMMIPQGTGRTPPRSWFSFQPQAAYLFPGQWTQVKAKLDVPSDADPGDYVAVLAASPQVPGAREDAHVNIGAGPRLEFTVVPGDPWQIALYKARRLYIRAMPWSTAGAVTLLALVAGVGLFWLRSRREDGEDAGFSHRSQ